MFDKIFSGIAIFLLAFLAFGVAILLMDKSQKEQEIVLNNIKGTVKVVPTNAKIYLTLTNKNTESSEKSQEEIMKISQNISLRLSEYDVTEKDIVVQNIRTHEHTYSTDEGEEKTTFYANTDLQISLSEKNYEKASKLIHSLASEKGVEMKSIEKGFEKMEDLYVQAQKNALQNAKKQAEEIAKELGVQIKRVHHVNVGQDGGSYGGYFPKTMTANAMPSEEKGVDFFQGEEEVTAYVDVVYSIK